MPAYGWGVTPGAATPGAPSGPPVSTTIVEPPAPARPRAGTLYLDLQPRAAGQLFVDGVYVGTLDDMGNELALAPGTRHLDIRQTGYEPFSLAVRVDADRALVYRGAFTPIAAVTVDPGPTAPDTPIARKPFFHIPGCYLGDVPPKDAGLPATCDLSQAVTFWP